MSEKDAKPWRALAALFPADATEQELARKIYQQSLYNHQLRLSTHDLLQLNHATLFDYYYRLARFTTPGRPYYRKQSTDWFAKSHLYRLNLREIGGLLNLLKIAPLYRGQNMALSALTKTESTAPYRLLSHALIEEDLHDYHLAQAGYTVTSFLNLIFEALRRLKIGIGLEWPLTISEQAPAVAHRADLFKAHKGHICFNDQNKEALTYLATASNRMADQYPFDFTFFNFDEREEPLADELSLFLTNQSRPRSSYALVGAELGAGPDRSVNNKDHYIRLDKLPEEEKLFWRYLGSNLGLFRYADQIENSPLALECRSRLTTSVDLSKMLLLEQIHRPDYSLLVKKDRHRLFISYFTYQDRQDEMVLDLRHYQPDLAFYSIESDFFYRGSYQYQDKELDSSPSLLLPPAAGGSVFCFLIS